jgi:heptosyltransferase-1
VPRILLIKTSSMGDVVHNLPVVSDLVRAFPGALIHWVVEEAFQPISRLHPGVTQILPVAMRRWRRRLLDSATWREFSSFRARLRDIRYDAILDTQGLLKSAAIACLARGPRHGLDWKSSREPLRLLYDHTYSIPWTLHAIERNRLLASKALGYTISAAPDFGIVARDPDFRALVERFPGHAFDGRYAVLLHATSAASKEWPEERWASLGQSLAANRMTVVLPFGNPVERGRSDRVAASVPGALVPPALRLDLLAALISRARMVIGVDTGLTHLSVALGRPTIGIYCATDPSATGLYGSARAVNLGGIGKMPSLEEVTIATKELLRKA